MSFPDELPPETQMGAVKLLRRIVVAVVGGTVLLIGGALIFLPGPGVLVILVGLGILAAEFAWARVWLVKLKATFSRNKKGAEKAPEMGRFSCAVRTDVPALWGYEETLTIWGTGLRSTPMDRKHAAVAALTVATPRTPRSASRDGLSGAIAVVPRPRS